MVGRPAPFQFTVEAVEKFKPFTVRKNGGDPAVSDAGTKALMRGGGAVVAGTPFPLRATAT
jgi:hypothetical protein